jgi:F-type H+-transporting ATPase subunit epsilon
MTNTLQLRVQTPDRLLVNCPVTELEFPGSDGYLRILPGHAPLITELTIGEVSYLYNGRRECLAVAHGIAQVRSEKVTIFARVAERAVDIDVARVQQDRLRAEERLRQCSSSTDIDRAMSALAWADARLEVVSVMAGK